MSRHKDIDFDDVPMQEVKVLFEWDNAPDANPESMALFLFYNPIESPDSTLRYDFANNKGGIIKIPYGGDIAVRWWFGKAAAKKPLSGHHLGIYGGILTYDFEFGGTGYMGGLPHETLWNRSLRMAGIEYGYSLSVARRLNIDFTIGIGYLGGKYIKYVPDHGRYLWQSTHKINWFGPTKAEISLVWLIGRGNYNASKKGGEL